MMNICMGELLKFERRSGASSPIKNSGKGGSQAVDDGLPIPLAAKHGWRDISEESFLVASTMEEPALIVENNGFRIWAGRPGEGVAVLIHGLGFNLVATMTPDEFQEIRGEFRYLDQGFTGCMMPGMQ
jgi:hypothetical protein